MSSTKTFYFSILHMWPENWFKLAHRLQDTNFGENVSSILYDINLLEKYVQYKKSLSANQFYFFDFTSRYQILSKSMRWLKSWKYLIYIIYIYKCKMVQKIAKRFFFQVEAIFCDFSIKVHFFIRALSIFLERLYQN